MPRGGERLEASCATVLSSSLATLLRNKCRLSSERTHVGEEDETVLMCERQGGSRQASVCFCAVEGEGQAAVQCAAQLLSKLVFLSVCLLPFSLSPSAGPGLLCLPEHYWRWGNLCEAKQAAALATMEKSRQRQHTSSCWWSSENYWNRLLLRTEQEI